jgi:hypothetical protein
MIDFIHVILLALLFLTAIVLLQKSFKKTNRPYETAKETWRLHDPQHQAHP